MKNSAYLLLHGWHGHSKENWFPWLVGELQKESATVFAPDLPDPIHPTPEAWLETIETYTEAMGGGTIIAHSLGAPLAIQYLMQTGISLDHLVFVAPTFPEQRNVTDLSAYEGLIETQNRFYANKEDLSQIEKVCSKISLFLSKDDPYIDYDHARAYYSQLE